MIEPEQRKFFARESGCAIECHLLRAIFQAGKAIGAEVFRIKHGRARASLLAVDAELFEQVEDELIHARIVVLRAHRGTELLLACLAFGRQFKQAVAAGVDEFGQLAMGCVGFADQCVDLDVGVLGAERMTLRLGE